MKKIFKFGVFFSLLMSLINSNIFASGTSMEQRKDLVLLRTIEKDNDLTKLSPGAHQRIEDLRAMEGQLNPVQKNILKLIDSNFVDDEQRDRALLARLKKDGDKTAISKKEELYLKHLNRISLRPAGYPKLTPIQRKLMHYIPLHLLQDKTSIW